MRGTSAVEEQRQQDQWQTEENAEGVPIVQREALSRSYAPREHSVEVKHWQNQQEIALQDSFVAMVLKQTDPLMGSLEMSVQQAHIVRLQALHQHLVHPGHIQMLLKMNRRKTALTAQVGPTVRGLETPSQPINVMQAITVHLGK